MNHFWYKVVFKGFGSVLVVAMAFLVPLFTIEGDVSSILTGFFIATATSNYLNFLALISTS